MVFSLASLLLFSSALSSITALPAPAKPSATAKAKTSTKSKAKSLASVARPTIDELLPTNSSIESWSTLAGADEKVALSDKALRSHNILPKMTHNVVAAPDGTQAFEAVYPKGSFNPSHSPRGGFQWYAPGPESVDLTTAKEAMFGYSVMFPNGFDFNKGGKLPGLYGGDDEQVAMGCSGGRRDTRCFSMRLMFRTDGAGEIYTYLPDGTANPKFKANLAMCKIPNSECNPTFGNSIARGAFKFEPGQWTTVSERVKLNTVGKSDGELELFVGGKSTIKVDNIAFRDSEKGKLRGLQMETFFGGGDKSWASPVDQKAFFTDLSVAILEKL